MQFILELWLYIMKYSQVFYNLVEDNKRLNIALQS